MDMQADAKWTLGSVGFMLALMGATAAFPGLRVLVIPVIFGALIAILFRTARPRSED
jgi:hypothetical protein